MVAGQDTDCAPDITPPAPKPQAPPRVPVNRHEATLTPAHLKAIREAANGKDAQQLAGIRTGLENRYKCKFSNLPAAAFPQVISLIKECSDV